MKTLKNCWNALGTTGKVFLVFFLFFFITKTLQR